MEFSISWKIIAKFQFHNLVKYAKSYRFGGKPVGRGNLLVLAFDPSILHPGLVDRLKAIVGAYYVAKTTNREFHILFNDEFNLIKFLKPASTDWSISSDEMDYSFTHSRIKNYYGMEVPTLKKSVRQYHIYNYIGWNILKRYHPEDWENQWTTLYKELFTPTSLLQKQIQGIKWKRTVMCRFTSALSMRWELRSHYILSSR